MHKLIIVPLLAALALLFTACNDGGGAQQKEIATGQANYTALQQKQPAHEMAYSPTRDTVNFFLDTWSHKGKDAYVYLLNDQGKAIGYYVTKRPPVSMCVSLRPTYTFVGTPDDGDSAKNQQVPAPSSDGAYYSGGECNTYYAEDANTGAYLQWTVGNGMNMLLYDQPLAPGIVGGAPNLGTLSK